jgi:trehalose 6-phosphate phosphatase
MRTDLLLVFDYDGTLSPIAPTPARARMRAATRRLLTRAARRYPCAVVSGRARADIAARLTGVGVRYLFGNHGLEPPGARRRPYPQVRGWLDPLRAGLEAEPGVVIEDKTHSVSVHYRAAPDHDQALALIEGVVKTLAGARIIFGAAAVNLLPRDGANKGVALRDALELSTCSHALYVGDDATDEDAFAAAGPGRLMGIRVGRSASSRARYHLASQADIDRLLAALIAGRV